MIGGGGGINIMDQAGNTSAQIDKHQNPNASPGGIGGAMAKAAESCSSHRVPPSQAHVQGLGDSFHRTAPISAPRLDSFNMLKVIGKGSFGQSIFFL